MHEIMALVVAILRVCPVGDSAPPDNVAEDDDIDSAPAPAGGAERVQRGKKRNAGVLVDSAAAPAAAEDDVDDGDTGGVGSRSLAELCTTHGGDVRALACRVLARVILRLPSWSALCEWWVRQ